MKLETIVKRLHKVVISVCLVNIMTATSFGQLWAMDLPASERLKISGFGTLGLVNATSESIGFRQDIGQHIGVYDDDIRLETDSLFGIQADFKVARNLDAGLQVVIQQQTDSGVLSRVNLGFLRYQINPNLTFRVGRLAGDIYMLSEYRNVGFAYLWARPVTEFYGTIPFDYYEGADATYTSRLGHGTLRTKMFYGAINATFPTKIGDDWNVEFNPYYGTNLIFEKENWQLRGGIARVSFATEFEPAAEFKSILSSIPSDTWSEASQLATDLDAKGSNVTYYSLGLAFDNAEWVIQSEAAYLDAETKIISSIYSFYFSIGKRFGPLTPYGLYAMGETDGGPRVISDPTPGLGLEALKDGAHLVFNGNRVEQQTVSLGLRWDFLDKICFKAQWDHTWLDKDGTWLWVKTESISDDQEIDVFSVSLNFIF